MLNYLNIIISMMCVEQQTKVKFTQLHILAHTRLWTSIGESVCLRA